MNNTLLQKFRSGLLLLAFSLSLSFNASAQTCGTPPTCESLGYINNPISCKGTNVLTCPFDNNKIYCIPAIKLGNILYSDMSQDPQIIKSKTPIGIIVDPANRIAIALQLSPYQLQFLRTVPSDLWAFNSVSGKSETNELLGEDPTNAPAANYAVNYTTPGTIAGDWFMANMSVLSAFRANQSLINNRLTALGKSKIPARVNDVIHIFSSTLSEKTAADGTTSINGVLELYNRKMTFLKPRFIISTTGLTSTAYVLPAIQF